MSGRPLCPAPSGSSKEFCNQCVNIAITNNSGSSYLMTQVSGPKTDQQCFFNNKSQTARTITGYSSHRIGVYYNSTYNLSKVNSVPLPVPPLYPGQIISPFADQWAIWSNEIGNVPP